MGVASKQVSIDIRCTHQKFESKEIQEKGEEKQNAPRLKCPRCDSTNTKFCYFNNYSRSQPRHYCRSCRRHWTEGGTLRSVPIGGRRRNKRRKVPPSIASSTGNLLIRDAEGLGAFDAMEGFFGVSPFTDDFVRLSSGFDLSYGERIYDKATASSCSSSPIAMAWVEKEKALPASYWDFWDGVEDFIR